MASSMISFLDLAVGNKPDVYELAPDAEAAETELAIAKPATTKAGITVVDSNWILTWRTIRPPDYTVLLVGILNSSTNWQMQIVGSNQASSHNCESPLRVGTCQY